MKGTWLFVVLAALTAAACSDDGPAGPSSPSISFAITAPTEIPTKGVVDVSVRILTASRVTYPLVVVFEKQNVGEEWFEAGRFILQSGSQLATARVPVLYDPRVRVTVSESSATEFSVSKTIAIDVIDFP